jgi:hypothetical protein
MTVFASSSAKASNVLTRLYALLESRPDVGSYRRKGLRIIEIILRRRYCSEIKNEDNFKLLLKIIYNGTLQTLTIERPALSP